MRYTRSQQIIADKLPSLSAQQIREIDRLFGAMRELSDSKTLHIQQLASGAFWYLFRNVFESTIAQPALNRSIAVAQLVLLVSSKATTRKGDSLL